MGRGVPDESTRSSPFVGWYSREWTPMLLYRWEPTLASLAKVFPLSAQRRKSRQRPLRCIQGSRACRSLGKVGSASRSDLEPASEPCASGSRTCAFWAEQEFHIRPRDNDDASFPSLSKDSWWAEQKPNQQVKSQYPLRSHCSRTLDCTSRHAAA